MLDTYDQIRERVLAIANHVYLTGDTIRVTAKKFKVSKSTVYRDLTERLPIIWPQLAPLIQNILMKNKKECSVRGGISTKKRWTTDS